MKGPLVERGATPRPVIGLSAYVERAQFGSWDRDCALIPRTYIDTVEVAGAVPVVLPPCADPSTAVGLLDGLILAGGPDVDPALYNAERHALTDAPRPQRDSWELALLAAARKRQLPVLGICRGMQLLNVAYGGDLVQALEETPHAALHRAQIGSFGRHAVRVRPASWCATAVGEAIDVPTYHHQAVRTIGRTLRPVAWAEDGCIEAVEGLQGPLLVGVQWHPEEDPRSPLLARFVQACAAAEQNPTELVELR